MNRLVGLFTFVFVVAMVAGIASVILDGWVLTRLWYWFVVPLGVRPLGVAQAIGLAVIVRWLTGYETPTKKDTGELILTLSLRPLIVLGIGALIAWFM
jgi:hypothetical protein